MHKHTHHWSAAWSFCASVCVCMYVCMYACVSVCIYVCMYVYIYIYIDIHTHIHIHTHSVYIHPSWDMVHNVSDVCMVKLLNASKVPHITMHDNALLGEGDKCAEVSRFLCVCERVWHTPTHTHIPKSLVYSTHNSRRKQTHICTYIHKYKSQTRKHNTVDRERDTIIFITHLKPLQPKTAITDD